MVMVGLALMVAGLWVAIMHEARKERERRWRREEEIKRDITFANWVDCVCRTDLADTDPWDRLGRLGKQYRL